MKGKTSHAKNIIKLIEEISPRHSTYQVFRDFVAMSSISIRNAIDRHDWDKYEEEYFSIIKRYDKTELDNFPRMLGELTFALEEDMSDILGQIFSELNLGNKWAGQFFTPDSVSRAMAALTFNDETESIIAKKGFISVSEPTVGGGAMIIALANHLKSQGINYQKRMHVTAIDIDIRSVHMAYLQFSLLHIPATVIHGDTLRLIEHSHWHTPAHELGLWSAKLGKAASLDQ